MTLQPPKTKKVSQSQRDSRMSAQEAHDALASVQAQLAAHAETCAACQAARSATGTFTGWSIWHVCEAARPMIRAKLSLEHRCYYLAQRARGKKSSQQETQEYVTHDAAITDEASRRVCGGGL